MTGILNSFINLFSKNQVEFEISKTDCSSLAEDKSFTFAFLCHPKISPFYYNNLKTSNVFIRLKIVNILRFL